MTMAPLWRIEVALTATVLLTFIVGAAATSCELQEQDFAAGTCLGQAEDCFASGSASFCECYQLHLSCLSSSCCEEALDVMAQNEDYYGYGYNYYGYGYNYYGYDSCDLSSLTCEAPTYKLCTPDTGQGSNTSHSECHYAGCSRWAPDKSNPSKCRQETVKYFTSSSGFLQVVFTSDSRGTQSGFVAHWNVSSSSGANVSCTCNEAMKAACGEVESSDTLSGTINISDGTVGSRYSNNARCEWVIAAESEISLTFALFDTEACCDYVTINQCQSPSCIAAEEIVKLSGTESPGSYSSPAVIDPIISAVNSFAVTAPATEPATNSECLGSDSAASYQWIRQIGDTCYKCPAGSTILPSERVTVGGRTESIVTYGCYSFAACWGGSFGWGSANGTISATGTFRVCKSCPDGSILRGQSCFKCPDGMEWNSTSRLCTRKDKCCAADENAIITCDDGYILTRTGVGCAGGIEQYECRSPEVQAMCAANSSDSDPMWVCKSMIMEGEMIGEIAVCPAPIATLKNRRFQGCSMNQTWSDIIRAWKMNPQIERYAEGGLGKLLTKGQHEVWLCDSADSCAEPVCHGYQLNNEHEKCVMSTGFNQQSPEDVCSSYAQLYQCYGQIYSQQGCCERFNEMFNESRARLNSQLNCNIAQACEQKENDMMCYAYNEESREFEPLDLNSNLNLVKKKPRITFASDGPPAAAAPSVSSLPAAAAAAAAQHRAAFDSSVGNNDKSHKNRLALLSSKEKTVKKMADSGEDSKQYYRSLFLDLLPDVVKVHLESRSVKSSSNTGTDNPKSSKRQWFGPGPSVAPAVLQEPVTVAVDEYTDI